MTTRTRRPKHDVDYIREQFAKNGDILLTKTYTSTKQRLRYKCHGCKQERTTCWNNYSRGTRCKSCFIQRQAGKVNLRRLTRLELRDKLYNMTEVCRILGVRYDDFRNLVCDCLLPKGSIKLGAKNYYTMKDIDSIREMIEIEG